MSYFLSNLRAFDVIAHATVVNITEKRLPAPQAKSTARWCDQTIEDDAFRFSMTTNPLPQRASVCLAACERSNASLLLVANNAAHDEDASRIRAVIHERGVDRSKTHRSKSQRTLAAKS